MRVRLIKLLHNRTLIYALVIAASLFWGVLQTATTYDSALGMGDNSTFYAFAKNIANGEVPFKDFIHFRTPGTVTLFAFFMEIFGRDQSTIDISTRIETLILYPLLFLISAMILFRKKSPWYVVVAFLGIVFLPGITQLRAGFGLLAIATYVASFDSQKYRKLLLILTGMLTSITFFFGQEIALMVGVCLVASEALHARYGGQLVKRIKYLGAGILAGILPLLLYMAVFSSLDTFIYYVTYYSFVLQPKFMNLPFPEFGYSTLVYYLPFILYGLCFWVLYAHKKLGIKEGIVLSFGILRLITALGRADFGHFIFSIAEIFVIVPYLLMQAKEVETSPRVFRKFLPYGAVLALLFYLSTKQSIALVGAPFVIVYALQQRKADLFGKTVTYRKNFEVYLALGASFVVFLYLMTPSYLGVVRYVKQELTIDDSQAYRIGGVKTDEITYKEIKAIQAVVKPIKPNTVFAFPIQPFYYSLSEHHASRFLTFEPQTTVDEQNETIQDLQRTKPQVVIFDPLQAHGLSGSLWKISDYLTAHYVVKKEVVMREDLWVMVPNAEPARNDKLVFRLFRDNTGVTAKTDVVAIQNTATGLQNAVLQNAPKIHFTVDTGKTGAHVRLELRNDTGQSGAPTVCGTARITYAGSAKSQEQKLCSSDGVVMIDLKKSQSSAQLELDNPNTYPVVWNDLSVTD